MRPFTDVIRDINGGKFSEELSDSLSDWVAACLATGKPGTMTLTLKLKPGKGGSTVLTVELECKVKEPDFERPSTFFFIANGNTLVTENPEQKKLPFKEIVDTSTGEIKQVAAH